MRFGVVFFLFCSNAFEENIPAMTSFETEHDDILSSMNVFFILLISFCFFFHLMFRFFSTTFGAQNINHPVRQVTFTPIRMTMVKEKKKSQNQKLKFVDSLSQFF